MKILIYSFFLRIKHTPDFKKDKKSIFNSFECKKMVLFQIFIISVSKKLDYQNLLICGIFFSNFSLSKIPVRKEFMKKMVDRKMWRYCMRG